jgi:hypothetical protein
MITSESAASSHGGVGRGVAMSEPTAVFSVFQAVP